MEVIQWVIGILVTIDLAVTSFMIRAIMAHERECKHVNARVAVLEADSERMKEDIGTHGTGMRGQLHDTSQMVQEHEVVLREMRRK